MEIGQRAHELFAGRWKIIISHIHRNKENEMNTLIASFDNLDRAADAMAALMDHGVSASSMDLVANSSHGELLIKRKDNDFAEKAKKGVTTTTGADAVEGAKKGGWIGLATGALAGIASLIIPGYGIVVGGGALATAAAAAIGTGAAGAATGGVSGYLVDMGADEAVARDMDETIKNGGGVLTVTGSHKAMSEVRGILEKYRANQILDRNTVAV
jgi:uncharacterized membrane protein